MKKVSEFYILKWKELPRAGILIKDFEDQNIDQKQQYKHEKDATSINN